MTLWERLTREPAEEDGVQEKCEVRIYDDDCRLLRAFKHCTGLKHDAWSIGFKDEFGLYHHYKGFTYSVDEEMTI